MTTADAHPTAAPAGKGPAPRWAARWRWLALGSALLLLYAAWAPWVTGAALNVLYVYPAALVSALVSPATPIAPLAWAALTALGLLIAPWLWSRHFRAVAALAFTIWVVLMTLVLVAAGAGVVVVFPAALSHANTIEALGLSVYGPASALLALVAAWWATAHLLRGALRQRHAQGWLPYGMGQRRAPPPAGTPPSARAWAGMLSGGAGTLTAGLLIWTIGFQLMPWAIYPCGSSTLGGGVCLGISSGQALSAALIHVPDGSRYFDPQAVLYVVPLVLLVGGLLLLYAVWRLPATAALCAWVAVWLLLATGAVALASAGLAVAIAAPSPSGVGSASPYPANVVAALGLALGWLALIPLVVVGLATRRRATS